MPKEHVLMTGASSAIGCEIIRQIAHEDLVVLAHFNVNGEQLEELAKGVPAKIVPIKADLRSDTDINSLLSVVEDSCSHPDKLVFLAAPKFALTRFRDLGWSDFQLQLDVQLRAAVLVCNRFLPKMAAAKVGRVVFVLSSYTFGIPPAAMAHYVTVKYALLGLMKALAGEYAGRGIGINAVSPSMVETGFLSTLPRKIVELTADQHPLKRNALPGDVAPLVKFLLSDQANYLTGSNIPITGGSA